MKGIMKVTKVTFIFLIIEVVIYGISHVTFFVTFLLPCVTFFDLMDILKDLLDQDKPLFPYFCNLQQINLW